MLSTPSRRRAQAALAAFGLTLTALPLTPLAFGQGTDSTVHTDAKGRHIAPHDTFYTLEYVSARTDKGVEGFPPGTEVHLVSVNRPAHTLTVSDGQANVDVAPNKLTNDLDIAAVVKAKDDAGQARIAQHQQEQEQAYEKYLKEVADYTTKDLEKREQQIRDANTRAQEQANAEQDTQPVDSSVTSSSNGYYNEGGYGYGSPYGYFVDNGAAISSRNTRGPGVSTNGTANAGRGAVSSQNTTTTGTAAQSRTSGTAQGSATQSTGGGSSSGGSTGGSRGGKP